MDPTTPTDEDAGMQAGFDSTEDGQSDNPGSQSTESATAKTPAGQQETEPKAATEPSPSEPPVADPFAGLPEAARKLLAEVPTLQSQLAATEERARRAEGQVRSLQGRFDKLEAPAATSAPKLDKLQHARDTLGADMPEVVDALEELAALLPPTQSAPPVASTPAAPAQAPAMAPTQQVDAQHSPHIVALDQVRPDWFQTMESADLKLWLTTQSPDLQTAYHRSATAGDVLTVLGAFDKHRQAIQDAASKDTTHAAVRNSRVAAALVPTGTAPTPRGGKRALSEEEAMKLGFES